LTTRRRNVAVIGGYRASAYEADLAYHLGKLLARDGYNLIQGGRQGVMLHAARGFQEQREISQSRCVVVGLLPGHDASDATAYLDVALPTGMGYLRNGLITCASDAVLAIGGMAGTLSEISLAWQMGKPIALLGSSRWSELLGDRPLDARRADRLIRLNGAEDAGVWLASQWTK